MNKLLDSALEWGIDEDKFWDMTLAELRRAITARRRAHNAKMQEQAVMDYAHASLVGCAFGCVLSEEAKLPEFKKFYSFLYTQEEMVRMEDEEAERQDKISEMNFKLFANSLKNKSNNKEVEKD